MSIDHKEEARPTRSVKDLGRAAVSGWLGTALEFMDFQLYSLAAAIVFNKVFFPNVDPAVGLIAAMATYGVGYVARLAGAIVFGRLGDRIGRKKILFITIALMGTSTTLIGALPTYQAIGITAPILLVVLRLLQGFGAGAEIAGSTVLLAEYAPPRRRGLVASLTALGTNSGTLGATAIWAILLLVMGDAQVLAWGWRIPFLGSFLLLIFAVWLRARLKESPVFEGRQESAAVPVVEKAATVKERRPFGRSFFLALALRFGQAGNSGLVQTFLVGYLVTTLGADKKLPTDAILIGSIIGFATVPLVGLLGDRIGRKRAYMLFTAATAILAFPVMALIVTGGAAGAILGIVLSLNIGVLALFSLESVTMPELFGSRTRFTQLGIAKEIGAMLTTAIGPVVAAALTQATKSWWPIAAMLVAYSAVTFIAAAISPETRGRDLVALEDAR